MDTTKVKDTSRPGKPGQVLQMGENQWGVFTPTGGEVATFVFERDACNLAHELFDYVRIDVARPYAAVLYYRKLKDLGITGDTARVFNDLRERGECPACYLGDACPDLHEMKNPSCDYYCG